MGYKYHGPNIDELPEGLQDRVREAARVAENETGALGVVVSDLTELLKTEPAKLWKLFGDFREVFVYDFGSLEEAYFRQDGRVYRLLFCGMSSPEDMEKVEKALGLDVIKRPRDNQNGAELRINGIPLERLCQPSNAKTYLFNYSGPWMARG